MRNQIHLTSGHHIERFPEYPGGPLSEEGLHSLAIFGPRGGYAGQLKYRDEDVETIINALRGTPPEGEP